jgi:hypothetical protein
MSQAKEAGDTVVADGCVSAFAALGGVVPVAGLPENPLPDGTVSTGGVTAEAAGLSADLTGAAASVRSDFADGLAAWTPAPSGVPGPRPGEPWESLPFDRAARADERLSAGRGGTASTAVASAAMPVAPSGTVPLADSTDPTGSTG